MGIYEGKYNLNEHQNKSTLHIAKNSSPPNIVHTKNYMFTIMNLVIHLSQGLNYRLVHVH